MGHYLRQFNPNRVLKTLSRYFTVHFGGKKKPLPSYLLNQKGSALVMASIFMLVAFTLITVGMNLISNSSRSVNEEQLYVGEAENMANAGLVDALSWYRRKGVVVQAYSQAYVMATSTPTFATNPQLTPQGSYTYVDQAFNPVNNPTNPALSDSINATIGLVNEFPLDAQSATANAVYYGRYEVRKVQAQPVTVGPSPTSTWDPYAAHDTSGSRIATRLNGDGLVWDVVSTGYIYKRLNTSWNSTTGTWSIPYNQSPNVIVAQAKVATEFRKISLNLPVTLETPVPVTIFGAIYDQSTTMINLPTNDQGYLYGAVSQSGTYAEVGENGPIVVPINTPTPVPTNTPIPGVIFDSSADGYTTAGKSVTWSHTVGGGLSNSIIVAEVFLDTASQTVSAAYFDGALMTLALRDTNAAETGDSEIWYLMNPAAGAHPVSIQLTGATNYQINGGSMSFSNVAQLGVSESENFTVATAAPDMAITTLANGSVLVSMCSEYAQKSITAKAGQTDKYQLTSNTDYTEGDYLGTNLAGPETIGYTFSGSSSEKADIASVELEQVDALTPTATPSPTWTPNYVCQGPPNEDTINQAGNPYCLNDPVTQGAIQAINVFGMNLSDLQEIADYYGDSNQPLNLPTTLGMVLIYYNGNLTYGATQPSPYQSLNAEGILVVNGDLNLLGGNGNNILPSQFNGIVFCTGQLTVSDGSAITGCVIMGEPYASSSAGTPGQVNLTGDSGLKGQISLSPSLISTALSQVAQYREDITSRRTLLSIPNL